MKNSLFLVHFVDEASSRKGQGLSLEKRKNLTPIGVRHSKIERFCRETLVTKGLAKEKRQNIPLPNLLKEREPLKQNLNILSITKKPRQQKHKIAQSSRLATMKVEKSFFLTLEVFWDFIRQGYRLQKPY